MKLQQPNFCFISRYLFSKLYFFLSLNEVLRILSALLTRKQKTINIDPSRFVAAPTKHSSGICYVFFLFFCVPESTRTIMMSKRVGGGTAEDAQFG